MSSEQNARLRTLWTVWDTMRASVAGGSLESLSKELSESLAVATPGMMAQVLLLDSAESRILLVLNSFCKEWPQAAQAVFPLLSSQLLGTQIPKDSFFGTVIRNEIEINIPLALVRHQRLDRILGGDYEVFKARNFPARGVKLDWELRSARERIGFPGGEYVAREVEDWFDQFLLIPFACARVGELPGLAGLVFLFPKPPRRVMKAGTSKKFSDELRDQVADLLLYMRSVAFTLQAYSVVQASTRGTERITEILRENALARYAQSRLRPHEGNGDLEQGVLIRLIGSVLRLPDDYIRRRLVRRTFESLDSSPELVAILADQGIRLVALLVLDKTSRDYIKAMEYWAATFLIEGVSRGDAIERLSIAALSMADLFHSRLLDHDARMRAMGTVFEAAKVAIERQDGAGYEEGICALEDLYAAGENEIRIDVTHFVAEYLKRRCAKREATEREVSMGLMMLGEDHPEDLVEAISSSLRLLEKSTRRESLADRLVLASTLFASLDKGVYGELRSPLGGIDVAAQKLDLVINEQNDIRYDREHPAAQREFLHVITVASSKGGVGKTTVAVGLAALLARRGIRTCLVELDFFGPSLEFTFRKPTPRPGCHGAGDLLYINDFLWANVFAHEATGAKRIDEIFQDRDHWRERFMAAASATIPWSERGLWRELSKNLWYVAAGSHPDLMELMQPMVMSRPGFSSVNTSLYDLETELRKDGFSVVIFDCPAELKEVTLPATEMACLTGGSTCFVSTLSRSSIQPILETLATGYQAQSRNYVIFNKTRGLEQRYLQDKRSFVEFWVAQQDGWGGVEEKLSHAMMDRLIHVEEIGCIPWNETIERLSQRRRGLADDDYQRLSTFVEKAIRKIVDFSL